MEQNSKTSARIERALEAIEHLASNLGFLAETMGETAKALNLLAEATASQYADEEEEEAGPTSLSDR